MKTNTRTQWDDEKEIFFRGLENRNYIGFEDCIAVAYPGTENTNDPRYIVYDFGDYRLRDDHYCVQHSPGLNCDELRKIFAAMEKAGADPTKYDIYFEIMY